MKLKSVAFIAAFEEEKFVELTLQLGGYFHIYIDKYYYGKIICIKNHWTVSPQHDHYFSQDDKDAMLERAGLFDIS